MVFLISKAFSLIHDLLFLSWDASLTVVNLITPKRKIGHVVPEGHPGADGKWPEYVPPQNGDSRSACPALNALANHGILPRDGRNITFKELARTVEASYNFSPSFAFFVANYAARMMKKIFRTHTFDLEELSVHNGIEHDASLTRQDVKFQPDQGKPDLRLVRGLLDSATGTDKNDGSTILTVADLSRYSAKRRAEARHSNPEFSLSQFHKMFGSSNSSTLLTIFGGRVKDLEPMLVEERIPHGWESKVRAQKGLTFVTFNSTVLKVEFGIDESKVPVKKQA